MKEQLQELMFQTHPSVFRTQTHRRTHIGECAVYNDLHTRCHVKIIYSTLEVINQTGQKSNIRCTVSTVSISDWVKL